MESVWISWGEREEDRECFPGISQLLYSEAAKRENADEEAERERRGGLGI